MKSTLVSGYALLGSNHRHTQGHSMPLTGQVELPSSLGLGASLAVSGVSSSDGCGGVLSCHCASMYVPPSSSVDAPERPLRHASRSFLQTDPPVITSDPVVSGILVLPRSSSPGCFSLASSTCPCPNHGCIQLWMGVMCGPLSVRCIWSEDHLGRHINFLELEIVFLALKKCVAHTSWFRWTAQL